MLSSAPRRSVLLAALVISLAITSAALAFVAQRLNSVPAAATEGTTAYDPPRPLSDFTLLSHQGQPLSLSDLRGRQVLLFFGYTHCPDVCPLTLMDYDRIHAALGDNAEDTAFVFVSVDGERDTPTRLAEYLELRDVEEFVIAMTGDERTLRRLGQDFNLFFQLKKDSPNQQDYLVDHTASTFLIDEAGQLAAMFAFGTTPETIVDFVRH